MERVAHDVIEVIEGDSLGAGGWGEVRVHGYVSWCQGGC